MLSVGTLACRMLAFLLLVEESGSQLSLRIGIHIFVVTLQMEKVRLDKG